MFLYSLAIFVVSLSVMGEKKNDLKHQTADKQKFEKKQLPQTDELIDPVSLPTEQFTVNHLHTAAERSHGRWSCSPRVSMVGTIRKMSLTIFCLDLA